MSVSPKYEKFAIAYRFFLQKELSKEPFTLEELCGVTGWKIETPRTYLTKKWEPSFIKRIDGKLYVEGISRYQEEQFIRYMSQKTDVSSDPFRPQLKPETERLVVKAREAALNALDIYNRPSTVFRTEGFIVMMVIAWRSLFHAIFAENNVDFIYRKSDGTAELDEKAWDLSRCVKESFGEATDAIRLNLEFIIGLRNQIEHRYVPAIDPHVAGECQALIMNFDARMVQEFGEYYALRESLAVPLQTSALRPSEQLEAMRKFQGKQYDDIKDYIDAFRNNLPDDIYQDPRYSFRVYLIPKTGNNANSSDLAFEFVKYDPAKPEDMAALQQQVVLIKDRQISVGNAGMFKPGQVAKMVSERINRPFSVHNHTQAWKKYKVRQSGETGEGCNNKYCHFDEVHRDHVYTQAWIDYLVKKMSDEAEYQTLLHYRE